MRGAVLERRHPKEPTGLQPVREDPEADGAMEQLFVSGVLVFLGLFFILCL